MVDWNAASCAKKGIIMEIVATTLLPLDRLTNYNNDACANLFPTFFFKHLDNEGLSKSNYISCSVFLICVICGVCVLKLVFKAS